MDREMVGQVRRFNRVVTQRVGALNDHFLGRDRPLGAARLLWEIGPDGRDVRSLRAQLGLDSGYLSRLLRSLEADGLISVESDEADKRVRVARPTPVGAAERQALDERSDEMAATLLEPLSPAQRARLVAAMADVERLLLAGMVEMLETNRALKEAIALYRSSGFCEVAPFNEEPYAHHWFEKSLLEKSLLEKSLLEKSLLEKS